jgi:aromatic amino acid aminotransferase I
MLRWVTEHTEIVCNPPYADWACALSVGSTSSLEQAFRIFCDRGDFVLSEEFTFSSAVETAAPLGVKFLGVKMDSEGLLPESMDEILSNWDEKARGARKPFLLYTVPSGQNPTGATQGLARRKEVYKVAQKHDLYILEDEPYYFLQMQPYTGPDAPDVPPPANNEEFLKALIPTYLSMDTDGRVMRMDSFSKVIAPGTRVGWITASEQITDRFIRSNENSNQNPSGISQIVLYKLLDESWGHGGYLQWLINLRLEYTKRRNVILAACEKYLPKDLVSWNPPSAGMFVSFLYREKRNAVRFTNIPSYGSKSHGRNTPTPRQNHSLRLKKRFSSPVSMRVFLSARVPGSRPRRPALLEAVLV